MLPLEHFIIFIKFQKQRMKEFKMHESNVKCTLKECKERFYQVDTMDFEALCKYADKCATCGNWILKENSVVQKTYNKVSLKWAEKFNEQHMKKLN